MTDTSAHVAQSRDIRLDLLRLLAILECIVAHAMMADHLDKTEFLSMMVFMPDTAAIFFMASGAIILQRRQQPGWRYIRHRILTFLPEFIIFSTVYALMSRWYGFEAPEISTVQSLCYMLVTPTWAPGWFILALMGLYFVTPMLWAWVRTATKRQIEIGIALWLCATIIPVIQPHTLVDIPSSIFGTLFNYAGYMVIGYYLVRWPLALRSRLFKVGYFGLCVGIGIIFGYLLGRSGAKWGYLSDVVTGLSINIVMLSLIQFGIVLLIPAHVFNGALGRAIVRLSLLSLGIYCCHWLVIRYWAIPEGINWIIGTLSALAVSIPLAWLMRSLRRLLTR